MIDSAISFIVECEKLKSISRRTNPVGLDRLENSAEHSWSLAIMVLALLPGIDCTLDQFRIMKMLLIHDIVEIDAGDTFCYDSQDGKTDREQKAAERIFGLLPERTAREFSDLWIEFEASVTKEAAFANALDRLLPLIQNFYNEGENWKKHGITFEQVYDRNKAIKNGSLVLWQYADKLIKEAIRRGFLGGEIK